jgi:cytochrome c peroxidase
MNNWKSSLLLSAAFVMALALSSCKQDAVETANNGTPGISPIPKSPGTIIVPADNQTNAAKIELGRHLFFDKELSVGNNDQQKVSCGSCHDPNAGFSDLRGTATSMGFNGHMGTRNAPSLANVAYNTFFTWDGRFKSLEEHAPGPIFNSLEMGNNFSKTAKDTVPSGYHSDPGNNDTLFLFKRLNGHDPDALGKTYPDLFIAAWGDGTISMDRIAKSIAQFERTFISTQSTFDKYNNGDQSAYKYNVKAEHGFQLFIDKQKANCISCHSGYNFTDQQFHNNGIGVGKDQDEGRTSITKNDADKYKFKTPSLRNVALSGPYMHDGRFQTLEEVLEHYNAGGTNSTTTQDSHIKPLNLSAEDMADIIAFLGTLSDDRFTLNNAFVNPWNK